MPAQVIDPRLNQTERTWGILCDLESTFFAKYEKGDINDPLRYAGQGTVLDITEYKDLLKPELWFGIEITREAVVKSVNDSLTGPLYKMLNKRIRETFFDPQGNPRKSTAEIRGEIRRNNKRINDSDISNAGTF